MVPHMPSALKSCPILAGAGLLHSCTRAKPLAEALLIELLICCTSWLLLWWAVQAHCCMLTASFIPAAAVVLLTHLECEQQLCHARVV